jgi:hypothetical protein
MTKLEDKIKAMLATMSGKKGSMDMTMPKEMEEMMKKL